MKLFLIRLSILSCLFLLVLAKNVCGQVSRINGRIIDNKGIPMSSANISLYDSAGKKSYFTLSDAEGKFNFDKNLTPGAYLIISFIQSGSRTIFLTTGKKIVDLGIEPLKALLEKHWSRLEHNIKHTNHVAWEINHDAEQTHYGSSHDPDLSWHEKREIFDT